MRNLNNVGLLAGIVIAVGMIGVNVSDGTFNVLDKTSEPSMDAGMIRGHLEIIHTDPDGNVKAYMQTDNAIVSQGEMCTARALFGASASGTGALRCQGDHVQFDTIALDDTSVAGGGVDILTLPSELAFGGLQRDDVTAGNGSITVQSEPSGLLSDATIRISNTFTYSGGVSPQLVTAAALFNSTNPNLDSLFAAKDFPSTVNLNPLDQLTVNWDIDISGSDPLL